MIEIKRGRYMSQWWFLGSDEAAFDVLGVLYRDENETVWQLIYRFRYHDGSGRGPWEDEDQKRWFQAKILGDEETALDAASAAFTMISKISNLDMHVIPTRTDDVEKNMNAIKREPWAHLKEIT